jgi:hypothetical protein
MVSICYTSILYSRNFVKPFCSHSACIELSLSLARNFDAVNPAFEKTHSHGTDVAEIAVNSFAMNMRQGKLLSLCCIVLCKDHPATVFNASVLLTQCILPPPSADVVLSSASS